MTTLHKILEANDPAHRSGLSNEEIRAIRTALLGGRKRGERTLPPLLALASLAMVVLFVAILIAQLPTIRHDMTTPAPNEPPSARQVQLTTPGGTRVIWIFNDRQPM